MPESAQPLVGRGATMIYGSDRLVGFGGTLDSGPGAHGGGGYYYISLS